MSVLLHVKIGMVVAVQIVGMLLVTKHKQHFIPNTTEDNSLFSTALPYVDEVFRLGFARTDVRYTTACSIRQRPVL